MPAVASPLTNLLAPSIAPKNCVSRSKSFRRCFACCSLIRPEFKSESIDICFPGIASNVKRADTSDTRPAPLVTTIIWIMKMMIKMTAPTIILFPATKFANVSITLPASPSVRTNRVDEIFNPNLNIVVSNRSVGKVENSRTFLVNNVNNRIVIDKAKFTINNKSKSGEGNGIMIIAKIRTTNVAIPISINAEALPFFLVSCAAITSPFLYLIFFSCCFH